MTVVACGDSKGNAVPSNAPAEASPSATSTVSVAASSDASGYDAKDLAVPEDFEIDARKAITKGTYKSELSSLAREIEVPPGSK